MSDRTSDQTRVDHVTDPEQSTGEILAHVSSHGSAPSLPSIDDDLSDADSAIGGLSVVSTTVSLRSSLYEHVVEDGRTYHRYKEGKYPLPNDEAEQERLDLQHAMMGITLNEKLYLAPLDPKNCKHALDFATGTGIWAIEFAQQHPNAQVLGTDLSTIQPEFVPPNCRFEIDDAEDEWNFAEKFDFIHGRALVTCFKDHAAVFREAFKSLAPGGYLELQDATFPLQYIGEPPVNSNLHKWAQLLEAGGAKAGRPWTNTRNYKRWLEEIGFEDVVEKRFFWPTSPWAKGAFYKTVGAYFQKDLSEGLEGISLKVLKTLGWTTEEIMAFLPDVRKDLHDTSIHAYCQIYVVYGRKPLESA